MGAAIFFPLFSVGAFFFFAIIWGKTFWGGLIHDFLLFLQDCLGREQDLALLIQEIIRIYNQDLCGGWL